VPLEDWGVLNCSRLKVGAAAQQAAAADADL